MVIIEDIVSQHAGEVAFLWLLRAKAVHAANFDLRELAQLEERMEAHLDGLRIAGDDGWRICAEALGQGESGEVFAAACIALDAQRDDWLSAVLLSMDEGRATAPGLISALGWVERSRLEGRVIGLLQSGEASFRRIGIEACRIRGADSGRYLERGLSDADPLLRAAALRSAGETRRTDLLSAVRENLTDDNEDCRFHAARAATLLNDPDGLHVLRMLATDSSSPHGYEAMQLLLRGLGRQEAMEWTRELNRNGGDVRRRVVLATGIIADPVSVPWLISQMRDPDLARLAGESFSMITGVDLSDLNLDSDRPEGFESGPTEDAADEDVSMDEDEHLTWPDASRVEQWWADHSTEFRAETRYLCGKPVGREQALNVLVSGKQRQRRAAALELAFVSPGEPVFNTSARAREQRALLGVR